MAIAVNLTFIREENSKAAMRILGHRQIQQKTKRLAIQILEHHHEEAEIILAGINNNGLFFAQMLVAELEALSETPRITLARLRLNPADPLSAEIAIELPVEYLRDKVIIVVDDVANTGRTLFYAFQPIMRTLPKKVEVAVLVDREHKSFPVRVDHVGLSLATTLREHIDVRIRDTEEQAVFLR